MKESQYADKLELEEFKHQVLEQVQIVMERTARMGDAFFDACSKVTAKAAVNELALAYLINELAQTLKQPAADEAIAGVKKHVRERVSLYLSGLDHVDQMAVDSFQLAIDQFENILTPALVQPPTRQ